MRPELAKVRLVPNNSVSMTYFVEAGPTREKSVNDRREVLQVLRYEFALGERSKSGCAVGLNSEGDVRSKLEAEAEACGHARC
jgi:hypothetical protein